MGGPRWLRGLGVLVAVGSAACGGGGPAASRPAGPRLTRVCFGDVPHGLQAQTSWLETSDHIRLFAFTSGTGKTGVVLAHESPGGACGWLPAVPTFTAHGLRVLGFDFRGFPPSASAPNRSSDDFAPDLQDGGRRAARGRCEEGLRRRRLLRRRSHARGSREAARSHGLREPLGRTRSSHDRKRPPRRPPPASAALVVAARRDYYLDAADARRLVRDAGSTDKQLALYFGSYHGWDLLEQAPFKREVWSRLLGWIRDH